MPFVFPDVLVLAGGGIVGEAWMSGVLAGIEDAAEVDFTRAEGFVGTSAGSIVAAGLVAGRSPRRPEDGPRHAGPTEGQDDAASGDADAAGPARYPEGALTRLARAAGRVAWAASAPLTPAAVALGAPAGAVARAALLSRAPDRGRSLAGLRAEVHRSGAAFDGRLRVVGVDKASGKRTVFGSPGAPRASVAQAVEASCSIPWVFAPVRIGDRRYVDGGAWSVTNLDAAAVGTHTRVLCLEPTSAVSGPGEAPSPFTALRHALRAAAAVEEAVLRRRGAVVQRVGPDAAASRAMGPNPMAGRRAGAALAAGFAQGRRLGAAKER